MLESNYSKNTFSCQQVQKTYNFVSCRIIRQPDCPTAHPRHIPIRLFWLNWEYPSRLWLISAMIPTTGGDSWLSCPDHAHSIPLLPCGTGIFLVLPAGDSWRFDITSVSYSPFGLPLVPLMLSYWRGEIKNINNFVSPPQAVIASESVALTFYGFTQREKLEYWIHEQVLSCYLSMFN